VKKMFIGTGKEASFSWGKRGGQAYSNFGASAGAAKLLDLDKERMAHALGISGHLCQVLTHVRYSFSDMGLSLNMACQDGKILAV
jgi:2-methylcitrate dehydratase PrpD